MSLGPVGMSGGMDINAMVSKIVDSERVPKQQRINNERTTIDASISAYGRLRESLDTMKNLMANFRQEKAFAARTVETTDEKVVSATATTDAIAGKYAVDVLQLAQSHKVASDVLPQDAKFGPGKLHISLGDDSFTINVRSNAKLVDVVRGINGEKDNPGVRASLINDVEGARLILASNLSGKEHQIKITVDAKQGNPLEKFAYQAQAKFQDYLGMNEVQAGQDSVVLLDGVARLSSHNNVIEDAIEGVDLTLKGQSDPNQAPAEIGVEYDRQGVRSDIDNFVAAYNSFYQTSQALANVDPLTGQKGPLSGDSTVRSADARLKSVFSSQIDKAPENLKSLTEFGITTTRQGTLEINYDMLDRQLNNHFNDLEKFFGGNTGFAKRIEDAIHGITGVTGSIRTREKSLTEQNYRLNDDQVALDRRMESIEKRTYAKFSAMQDATGKMQGQLGALMSALG
ncbi:flagellar filament capping protein FliD [Vibrio sp. FJH11]